MCQPQGERAAVLQDPDLADGTVGQRTARGKHREKGGSGELATREGACWSERSWEEGALEGRAQAPVPGATASLQYWDFPGCPVPLDSALSLLGPDSAPGQGAEIPRATQHAPRPPKHKNMIFSVSSPGDGTS